MNLSYEDDHCFSSNSATEFHFYRKDSGSCEKLNTLKKMSYTNEKFIKLSLSICRNQAVFKKSASFMET